METNIKHKAVALVPVLSVIGAVLSLISLYQHTALVHGVATGPSFCNLSAEVNCDAVNASAWSTVLGQPLAAYGVAFYFLIFFGWVATLRKPALSQTHFVALLSFFSGIAFLASIALFAISKFVIGTLCLLCMGMYAVNAALFMLALLIPAQGSGLVHKFLLGIKLCIQFPKFLLSSSAQQLSDGDKNSADKNSGDKNTSDKNTVRLQVFGIASILCAVFFLPNFMYAVFMRDKQVERSLSQVSEQVWQSWQNAPVSNLGLDFDSAISRDYAYGADGADGADGAAFQLVEFVDFECPACRMAYREFKKLAQKFDGQLQIVLKNYPLDNSCNPSMPRPLHASACFLASVSRCAGEQGKFWEVTDYLFELPIVEAEASFEEVRSEAFKAVELFELDEQALRECLGSPRVLAKLHSDIELGNQLGLRGTPSLWLNGKKLEVSHPEVVESLIKRAMRQ